MSETPRFEIQRDFEPWQLSPSMDGTWQFPGKVTYRIDGRKVQRAEFVARLLEHHPCADIGEESH